MDKYKLGLVLLSLSAMVGSVVATTGEDINNSLLLLVNAIPIIALAIVGIVGIVGSLIAVVILVLLVTWFKDILMLPLDIVKNSMRGIRK